MKTSYYGDIEVVVKMRYRLDAVFDKVGKDGLPTKAMALKMIVNGDYNDISDEEQLEVIEVLSVGENNVQDDEDDSEDEEE